MMRQILIAALMAAGLATAAQAGPGSDFATFAQRLGGEASTRSQAAALRPAAPAARLDVEDPFAFDLEQFSVEALMLSRQIDAAGGPVDLRCIFRGMSEDAGRRLEALNAADTAAEQAHIYAGLADLMRDAAEIAPAIDGETVLTTTVRPAPCPAAAHDQG